ncbi:MAG: response regulator [Lamprobacter sp.]|uniref:response regulator n=1 Tax=Lamprobacter sp. TaxID=3100796 RepID=UPI002B25C8EE|nr:response regulator [Lamprobacter sp.]MEA3642051.1 response regulator [Lamprobacter sp.]
MSDDIPTRLLIVDDIPTMLQTLRFALEDQGFEVVAAAADGQEALNLLKRERERLRVDMVLADWHMPKMNGVELLRQIRANPKTAKLPFLMVTGEIERTKVAEAIKCGVTDFVAKPFTSESLAKRVRSALKYGASAMHVPTGADPSNPLSRALEAQSGPRQRIILTVDDEPDNIEIVAEALKPQYNVKAAINGRIALKVAAAQPPPDLILLDIMMPEMDGMEVLSKLKQNPRTASIPVIFVTAKWTNDEVATGLTAGADDYIVKPIQPIILKARIETQLRLKDAADALREQLDLTVAHIRLQEDIDRMVRHDIRNPLTAIIGYADELGEQGYLTPVQQELREKIEQAAFTVSELVNFSVELLRIERGEYTPKLAPVNLVDLAQRVMRDLQPLARAGMVELLLQEHDRPEALVASGERLLIYTILANLIRNAIEATAARGSVRIRFEHGEGQIKVHVMNPALVPAAIRERLFEKGATFGKEDGSGLGTYSAKLMAEVLGGSISFISTEKERTCFSVTLPAHHGR